VSIDRPTPWWVSLWIKLALLVGWCYAATWLMGWVGLLSAGVCGMAIILPRYILDGSSGFFGWAKERVWHEWDGEYLNYNGIHLRAWRITGDLWLSARDLAVALGIEPFDAKRLARLLPLGTFEADEKGRDLLVNEEGIRAWVAPMDGRDSLKFRLWLERNVLALEAERRRRRTMDPKE
jgi:hypothetical protein